MLGELTTRSIKPQDSPNTLWEHYSIPAFDVDRTPALDLGADIKSNKYRVHPHSVLASKLNPQFPRIWLPNVQSEDEAICSTEFMPFVPHQKNWRPYLYECIYSEPVQSEMLNRATGSTGSRQRVKPREVALISVPIPNENLIASFGSTAGFLTGRTRQLLSILHPKFTREELGQECVSEIGEGGGLADVSCLLVRVMALQCYQSLR